MKHKALGKSLRWRPWWASAIAGAVWVTFAFLPVNEWLARFAFLAIGIRVILDAITIHRSQPGGHVRPETVATLEHKGTVVETQREASAP